MNNFEIIYIIEKYCNNNSITLTKLSANYILKLTKGSNIRYIFNYRFDVNSSATLLICNDKAGTSTVLNSFNILFPIWYTAIPNSHANNVWNPTALSIFLVPPSSLFIAPIAPKHGAENKLNTINAYADAGLKNPNIPLSEKISFPSSTSSASPLITAL